MSKDICDDICVDVARKIGEVGPSVAVALEFPMSSYFDVLRGLVDNFAHEKGMQCIYITSAVPAKTIQGTLEALEIDPSGISFVDTISQMIMEPLERGSTSIIYVESPTVLENVVLKVDYLNRKLKEGPKLVVVDSINSLAIHNDAKMLSEFLHVLISCLSAKEAYPVILSMQEQLRPDVHEMLTLVCDRVINLGEP
ncbi:MAG: ATPase domain-containing protein [Methanomassiliicoccus sp.]|nr:ATPase domain-containing protein [Methanomassiliicoccus sp.]